MCIMLSGKKKCFCTVSNPPKWIMQKLLEMNWQRDDIAMVFLFVFQNPEKSSVALLW